MSATEIKEVFIGTHPGEFHADEVLGIATLRLALLDRIPADKEAPQIEIIRSRNPQDLAICDYLVDVGLEYNHTERKFDHHQPEGAGQRDNDIPYASFGLVWKHFGALVCGDRGDHKLEYADFIDRHFVQIIDAYDNGIELFHTSDTKNLSDILPGQDIVNCNSLPNKTESEKFERALAVAEFMIESRIANAITVCDTRPHILKALEEQKNPDVVVLPVEGISWQTELPEFSREALFVVQPDANGSDRWVVRSMPEAPNSVTRRALFPEGWRSGDPSEITDATGVDNVAFIHQGGFFAATNDRESAEQLAKQAAEQIKKAA